MDQFLSVLQSEGRPESGNAGAKEESRSVQNQAVIDGNTKYRFYFHFEKTAQHRDVDGL